MNSARYHIYGLVVESELAFPHWPNANEQPPNVEPQIKIKIGSVPREWDDHLPDGNWYAVHQDQVFIKIENVGRFLISNGQSVLFESGGNSSEDAWLYVEGVITGALLHQRRIWPLHASAVLNPHGSVTAFVGQRGIGKSTLLFELQSRGHAVIADDIVAITFDEIGRPLVHPGFPQGKLRMDAAQNFGLDIAKLRPLQNSVGDKFAVKFERGFCWSQHQLSEVFVLERTDGPLLECHELTGLEKLRQLSDNTYRLELLSADEDYRRLFNNILTASKHVRTFRLTRPAIGNSVRELGRFVEARWKRQ